MKRQLYEEEGSTCLFDRRMRKAHNRAADAEVEFITKLFANRYRDFSVKHFYEFVQREHEIKRSYNWVKNKLMDGGLVVKSSRGGKYLMRRERKPSLNIS